jgi:hypothetical protein
MMYVSIVEGESCDKCKKVGNKDNPVLDLHVRTRQENHVIFVHVGCLKRLLDKLKVGTGSS